jgi:hypothetical protein
MPVSDAPERSLQILGFPEPIDPDVVHLENMASALFLAPAASRPVGAERPVPVRAASGVGFGAAEPVRAGQHLQRRAAPAHGEHQVAVGQFSLTDIGLELGDDLAGQLERPRPRPDHPTSPRRPLSRPAATPVGGGAHLQETLAMAN